MQKLFNDAVVETEDIDDLVDSLPTQHAKMLDQAEVKNGERLGVVTGNTDTFSAVCKMHTPRGSRRQTDLDDASQHLKSAKSGDSSSSQAH